MLRIRLRRMGNRNRPFYRVVVSDSRKTPISSALEEVGHYDPTKGMASAHLETEKIQQWVAKGARMSSTVAKLVKFQKAQPAASADTAATEAVAEAEQADSAA